MHERLLSHGALEKNFFFLFLLYSGTKKSVRLNTLSTRQHLVCLLNSEQLHYQKMLSFFLRGSREREYPFIISKKRGTEWQLFILDIEGYHLSVSLKTF